MANSSLLPPEIHAAIGQRWPIFPVHAKGKSPLVPEWPKRASSDLEVLLGWTGEYPGCNWGLATGTQSVVVVDIDGLEGRSSVEDLENSGFIFPRTLEVVTGRPDGGVHKYYRAPEGVEIRNDQNGKIGPHIDVRGDGGFVVFPPSVHQTGRQYHFVDPSAPIAEMPQWMVQKLTDWREKEAATQSAAQSKVSKGSRTNTLFSIAGSMRNKGLSTDAIKQALLAANSTFDPPLPEDKVIATAKGIERYPAGQIAESPMTIHKRARVVCLIDVQAKRVRWLREPYIPFGMVSQISGDPGAGKSFVAMAIAADVTKKSGGVLYMTLENPLAEVMRPRFDSLGGDPERLWVVNGTEYEDENGTEERGIITLSDLDLLDEIIQSNSIRLLVIDPLTSFFGTGKNMNHASDTRPIFDRLAVMAEKHDLAVLVIRHNNKQTGGKAIYRGAGSIDMTGAVRSEMLAAVSPENPEQRALAHIKTNIGPQGKTQGYVIEPDGQGGARFSWTGELAITAEELNAAPEAPETRTKQDEAREWLLEILRSGAKEQKEIETLATNAGLKWRTVRRAKDDCREIKSRKASMAAGWIWYLAENGRLQA
jgi:hypothetical protein